MAPNLGTGSPAPLTLEEAPEVKQPEAKQEQKPQHWFLVSGEIEYVMGAGSPADPKRLERINVNCLFFGDSRELRVRDLAKIQTTLQMQFHTKHMRTHARPPEEITDVTIFAFSHMGCMTRDEFYAGAPAPGTVQQ